MQRKTFIAVWFSAGIAVGSLRLSPALARERIVRTEHTSRPDRSWLVGRPGGCASVRKRRANNAADRSFAALLEEAKW